MIFKLLLPLMVSLSLPVEARELFTSCEKLLRIETQTIRLESAGRGVYFNRWKLPHGVQFTEVLTALINKAKGPVLLFDTNPSSETWGDRNIVPTDFITAKSKAYADLSPVEKAWLFGDFAQKMISAKGKSVFIFDHHFDSKLLARTSSTPLILDFLEWLDRDFDPGQAKRVRSYLRSALVLRDHSDADIVLANLALELMDQPSVRAELGPFMRQIALYNDHLHLDPELTPKEAHRVYQGYQLMLAVEKWIERPPYGSFARALKLLEPALRHIQDPDFKLPKTSKDLKQVIQDYEAGAKEDEKLRERIEKMMNKGNRVDLRGEVLVLRYKASEEIPSGSDSLRHLLELAPEVMKMVKVLVVVCSREVSGPEELLHYIKIRGVDPDFNLDPVLREASLHYPAAGGRAGAGSLYPPSGRPASPDQLQADIQWLTHRLNAEIEVQLRPPQK